MKAVLFLGIFGLGIFVGMILPTLPSQEVNIDDIEKVIGDSVSEMDLVFVDPPLYFLRDSQEANGKNGWVFLTPFLEELVGFSFGATKDGRKLLSVHIGDNFGIAYQISAELGHELMLENEGGAFRDISINGIWDVRYKYDEVINTSIWFDGNWLLVETGPRYDDGRYQAISADGRVFSFDQDHEAWLEIHGQDDRQ